MYTRYNPFLIYTQLFSRILIKYYIGLFQNKIFGFYLTVHFLGKGQGFFPLLFFSFGFNFICFIQTLGQRIFTFNICILVGL